MKEYVGYKEPIGDGFFNMGVTDEEIIRCRDCKHSRQMPREAKTSKLDCGYFAQWDYYNDEPGYCFVEPDGFCSWAERDDK